VIREYVHYPGIDQPHSMKDASGVYHYAMEHPGHVSALINASNQTVNGYKYDAWGEVVSVSEGVQQPLRYMARELDAVTGLYYVRNRWYDPVANRFVSEDPIGLAGGINTYAYVGNDPLNLRDPLGLCPQGFKASETTVGTGRNARKVSVCIDSHGNMLLTVPGVSGTARQECNSQYRGEYIFVPARRRSFHEQEQYDRSPQGQIDAAIAEEQEL
jgi:RHS repeat-associated protein